MTYAHKVHCMAAAALLACVPLLGCEEKKAQNAEPPKPSSSAATEVTKQAKFIAVGKPLAQWRLEDVKSSLTASGFSVGTSQNTEGDNGGGVKNQQLRVVAKRDDKYLEVFVVHFEGKDEKAVKEAMKSSRGQHEEAVTHEEGNSLAYFESEDKELAKGAAAAFLEKHPSG